MAVKSLIFIFVLVSFGRVESASLFERSYEYVLSLGKNIAPSFMSILDCMGEEEPWACAKTKAGTILEKWDQDVEKQRRSWQDAADAEVVQSGRSIGEMPSTIGREVETSLNSLADLVQHGVARAMARKKHDSGGIDTIMISASGGEKKKKEKKKKQKPTKIQIVQMPMGSMVKETGRSMPVQTWVVGHEESRHFDGSNAHGSDRNAVESSQNHVELVKSAVESAETVVASANSDVESAPASVVASGSSRRARGFMEDAWSIGEKTIDSLAEHAISSENADNGFENDKSSLDEQRGKKKKKKKAILKLLLLGAVLKAKIGTLLQILSFKLQVKFFIIALLGLGINLARFWVDLKKQHTPPQKVIYYEHAQHQHHYDHEEEPPAWGGWSRSITPEDSDAEVERYMHSPYQAQERIAQNYVHPAPTRT